MFGGLLLCPECFDRELQSECGKHLLDRLEVHLGARLKRLVDTFPSEPGCLSHLRHVTRAGNVAGLLQVFEQVRKL